MAHLLGTDKPNDLRPENSEEQSQLNRPPNRLLEDERIKLIGGYLDESSKGGRFGGIAASVPQRQGRDHP